VVVPYGVDTAAIDRFSGSTSPARARAALAIPGDGPLILVMGTLEPRKAQTVVAQAFDRLASDHPDAVLALVGMVPGPDLEALTRYVSEAGLESRCLLVPLVADTFTWYRAADLLVCASDVESMPRTVLEAMAFGIPVVSTDVFGLAELLSDGETGFLFPARSLVDLEGAMRRALTLPAGALAEVGSAGSALVHDRYDSAGYAREILALLRGLLDRPGALPGELLGRG
jgi:glycosyltransferase involved in cell wall biosynthesis